jgi:hypothetical protein
VEFARQRHERSVESLVVHDEGRGTTVDRRRRFSPRRRLSRCPRGALGWCDVEQGRRRAHAGPDDAHVFALASFDAGSGPELYAGGIFTGVGGTAADRIAKWDGVVLDACRLRCETAGCRSCSSPTSDRGRTSMPPASSRPSAASPPARSHVGTARAGPRSGRSA